MPLEQSLIDFELPQNPNGVVFTAPAFELLNGRDWWDVVALVVPPLQRFQAESGLDCTVHLGWRVAVGRRNDRIPVLLAAFVFDGPATAGHFAVLESSMAHSAQRWSSAQIERIPPNCPPVLAATADGPRVLWTSHAEGPRVPQLGVSGRAVVLSWNAPDAIPEHFGVSALAHPAARSSHNLQYERQRLVFAHHYSQHIIEADGIVREEEQAFMDAVFPELLFERLGVRDENAMAEELKLARDALPKLLGHHDKLAMIGLFFSACYSDGALDAREMKVLGEAGAALGLTRQQIVTYLQRLW